MSDILWETLLWSTILLSVGHHQNTVVTIVLQADKVFVKLTCLMKPHLKGKNCSFYILSEELSNFLSNNLIPVTTSSHSASGHAWKTFISVLFLKNFVFRLQPLDHIWNLFLPLSPHALNNSFFTHTLNFYHTCIN